MAFLSTKASAEATAEVRVRRGDELGRILECLGHRKLWGPRGAVVQATKLNTKKVDADGDLIFPRTTIKVPLRDGFAFSESWREECFGDQPLAIGKPKKSRAVAAAEEYASGPKECPAPAPATAEKECPAPPPAKECAECATCPANPPCNPNSVDDSPRYGYVRVGIDNYSQSIQTGGPGNPRARYGGVGAAVGGFYPLSDRWSLFGEVEALALVLWTDGDVLQPITLQAGAYYRLSGDEQREIQLAPSVRYDTLIRSSRNTRYGDLWGFGGTAQLREKLFGKAAVLSLGLWLYGSDTSVISGNRRGSVCLGGASNVALAKERWQVQFCYEGLSLDAFSNGSGSQDHFRLSTIFRF